MKIKEGYLLDTIGEQKVAISLDSSNDKFTGIIKLNAVGAFLWELLTEETTEEVLVQKIIEKYGIGEATAKRDIEKFVAKLEENRILER